MNREIHVRFWEGLGVRFPRATHCDRLAGQCVFAWGGIVLPAPRHSKSSRGTPRLRRLPRILHGAPRLAARTTALNS